MAHNRTGIHFVGMGISGGEEGALHGPSIMVGGKKDAWEHLKPVLQSIAAKVHFNHVKNHKNEGMDEGM
jgi:6-phosphogluconate dehydrogenase